KRGDGDLTLGGTINLGNTLNLERGTVLFTTAPTFSNATILLGNRNTAVAALANGVVKMAFSAPSFTLTNALNVRANSGFLTTVENQNASGTLTLSGAITLSDKLALSAVSGGALTANSAISGSGELLKVGAGTVTLSGANTHSGMNTLSGGVLLLGNDSALGSNKLLINWADNTAKTLATSGSATRTIANNLEIYNDLTLGQASGNTGSLILNGAVALGNEVGTRQVTVADGTSHTFGGVISGLRGIVKKGTGTLTLGGNNTFSGANYLVEGTTLLTSATGAGTGIQYLGETSGSGSATLAVGGSGLTVGNAITVRTGSSGTKKIDAVNTTGTTTLSGNLTLDGGATLAATNGGGLNLGGSTLTFGNTM
ncbi:MAG: hypothetical protein EBT95_10975, partial [Verrucomicrobia bacterium]|nr:hypothetical protein [Verrucomicrobiota bacterium]